MFRWRIASRTGEIHTGEDVFPSQELKAQAAVFELFLSDSAIIRAPYGRSIIGNNISVAVPDGHRLIFKRATQFDVRIIDGVRLNEGCEYIIAFERL